MVQKTRAQRRLSAVLAAARTAIGGRRVTLADLARTSGYGSGTLRLYLAEYQSVQRNDPAAVRLAVRLEAALKELNESS